MRCSAIQGKLSAFYDGALRETERAAVEAHLRECAECQRELTSLQTTSQLLQAWEAPKVNPRVQMAFMAKLEERAARQPWWAALFAGRQKQVAWTTAAAAVLMVVAWGVNRPTPQPDDESSHHRSFTPARTEPNKKIGSDRLAMDKESEKKPPSRPLRAAAPPAENAAKGSPLLRLPLSERMKGKGLPDNVTQSDRLRHIRIAAMPPSPSTARAPESLGTATGDVDAKMDVKMGRGKAKDELSHEGNVWLTLNTVPRPAEEAANYVRTIVAEVTEPVSVELVDATAVAYVEKRPERMLTDWITETGD